MLRYTPRPRRGRSQARGGGGALDGLCGGLRSRRRGSRRRVPAALRSRDIDGVIRLRLGCKRLDRKLGRRERLDVEAFGDIVALVARICIALCGGEAEPFEGFGEVLFDADAAGIEDAEVELAVGDAAIG